jgi:hypothetical protein
MTVATPPPGLYPDVPFADYLAWEAASNSRLKLLRDKTPLHLKWDLDHPAEPTEAMLIGSATHTAVLEPDLFDERYIRGVEGDGRTKAVKEARARLEAEAGDRQVLPPKDWDLALRLRDAIWAHPVAKHLMIGDSERSMLWKDPETGVLCKGRLDKICANVPAILDLKTSRDASPHAFSRQGLYGLRYYLQAALYLTGAQEVGLPHDTFAIVAIEKDPPYAIAVYDVEPELLLKGAEEARGLLRRYRACLETDTWPGWTEVARLDVPGWAHREIEENVEVMG